MSRHFDVVGPDDDDVQGDVMGDVMGYDDEGGAQVVGYTDEGYPIVSGAAARRGGRRRLPGGNVRVVKPSWRQGQLAPGVQAPDQGLLPLPMGNFTFSVANGQTFTFQGQVQKPFRGERILLTVVRTGATATGRLLSQLFVGTDLAMLDVAPVDLEQLGAANAFGVRLTMKPAQPGVFLRFVTTLSTAVAGVDTIFASCQVLGRNIH